MRCTKCDFENPDDAQFCIECGHPLEFRCPQCNAVTPVSGKFCKSCGQNLSKPDIPASRDLSFEEKLDKIQKYLPKGLTEKILSQRDRIEGEHKQVTVMFCDLEGFTPLVERIGADEAFEVMDKVYELLIHAVRDYDGTINEMKGDGIIALFGAPIALEDASQRAIHSALAIHRQLAIFNDELKAEKKDIPALKMRIGIHSGPVVVGTLGNDLRVEFKAVGDTVNLAARMEQLAEPGTTYITQDTFKLTEGLFRFEALGERPIKGKDQPVTVYQVITTSSRRTRFDVNAERGLTPLVGRERELEILLDGFETVKSGRGQAISIVAEAGVGKSRLLYEFRKSIENEDITLLEGKCLSYARNVAYHPIIDILKAYFRIDDRDTESDIKPKAITILEDTGIELPSTLPYLLDLLSVKDSGIEQLNISPESKKERVVESLQRTILKGSEQRPLIMIFEDLHWIDNATEALLKDILASIPGSRVFLLFSYRPEFVQTWGGKSYHNQLHLNRLSNRECLTMLSYLLGSEDIEEDLKELVLTKTEGIPFFIEEFVKSLVNLEIIEKRDKFCLVKDFQSLAIPSTIQDMIMARVDSLPESAKEVLQAGSVIEREFPLDILKQVVNFPEPELMSNLSLLKDSELLYERGVYPDSIFIFKHALTREVVYDSVLSNRKKGLHQKTGEALEKVHQQQIEEHYESLVEHLINSEDYAKAAKYANLASIKARRSFLQHEAIEFQKKQIHSFEKLNQTDEIQEETIKARILLGQYYTNMNWHVDAKKAVEPVEKLSRQPGYKKYLSQILALYGFYYMNVEGNSRKSLECLENALRDAEEADDDRSRYVAYSYYGWVLWAVGEFKRSLEYWTKSAEYELGQRYASVFQRKTHSSLIYFYTGKIDLSFQISSDTLKLAEDSGLDGTRIAATLNTCLGMSYLGKRDLNSAVHYLQKGSDLNLKLRGPAWYIWSNILLAETYFELGDFQLAENHYENTIQTSEQSKLIPKYHHVAVIGQALARVKSGKPDLDLDLLQRVAEPEDVRVFSGLKARLMGEILLHLGDQYVSEAEMWIQKAIFCNSEIGMRFYLARDHALYSDFYRHQNNLPQAREHLTKAIDIMKECGADGWVAKYEKEFELIKV